MKKDPKAACCNRILSGHLFLQNNFMTALQLYPFSQFNTPFPCLQQIPTEINSFDILFFLPKMLNEMKYQLIGVSFQFIHSTL